MRTKFSELYTDHSWNNLIILLEILKKIIFCTCEWGILPQKEKHFYAKALGSDGDFGYLYGVHINNGKSLLLLNIHTQPHTRTHTQNILR